MIIQGMGIRKVPKNRDKTPTPLLDSTAQKDGVFIPSLNKTFKLVELSDERFSINLSEPGSVAYWPEVAEEDVDRLVSFLWVVEDHPPLDAIIEISVEDGAILGALKVSDLCHVLGDAREKLVAYLNVACAVMKEDLSLGLKLLGTVGRLCFPPRPVSSAFDLRNRRMKVTWRK